MFEEDNTIIGVMPKRTERIINKFKELMQHFSVILLAGVLVYGIFSLIGLVFYIWWFAGVMLFLLIMGLAVSFLLWVIE